jgi:lysophospholipase L1-like esterase
MNGGRESGPFSCLVAIGDSITMGASATKPEYSWVSRLARMLTEFQDEPLRVVNVGLSGNLISPRSRAYSHPDSGKPSGLERYRRDVIPFHPDLVLISYGLNDMRCGTPVHIFLEDLDAMVQGIRGRTGATILLLGVYFMTGYERHGDVWAYGSRVSTTAWNNSMREYATANDLLFADVYRAQGEADWGISEDGVHPNNLGHALVAQAVFQTIVAQSRGMGLKSFRDARTYVPWGDAFEGPLRTYAGIAAEE